MDHQPIPAPSSSHSVESQIAVWVQAHHPSLNVNLLGAQNDLEAVMNWLEEFKHSPHTFRSYEKESLRFLYWLGIAYKIPLSDVRKQHIHHYRTFLLNPQPEDFWCSPPSMRKRSRQTSQWKPFSGPLGYRSIQTAMSILQGLFDYLMNARYLSANPFSLIKQKLTESFDLEERKIQVTERLLSLEDFQMLLKGLEGLKTDGAKSELWIERSRFILFFLSYMGLRVSEFVQAKWNHFLFHEGHWWLVVHGKGSKTARVPVNTHCLVIINHYRKTLGLRPLQATALNDDPLCPAFSTSGEIIFHKALSDRSIHLFCKDIASKASLYSQSDFQKSKFHKFSPHWLRHFSASMQALSDIPFEMIKAHHRHSKDETTRIYLHHDDRKRQDWADKLNIGALILKNPLKNQSSD